MKVKDVIEFKSGIPATLYKGVITWKDERARELGVALLSPKTVRGGCMVINIDEAKPEVVEEYTPHTFKQNLSELSEEDLRAEIAEIRESRGARKRKVLKQPKPKAIKQLELLSNDTIDKILGNK